MCHPTNASGLYEVRSPGNGYVVERLINPGNFMRQDNASSLFTIGDIKQVWIWANVFETDIAKVKTGYAAEIRTVAYPDKVYYGKVDKVSEFLDPETKVMKIRIVLPNTDGLLKPDMFANISIYNDEAQKMLCIPSRAVISDNGKNYVVVFNNQKDVKIKEIGILKSDDNTTYVTSGLEEGQRLIT